MTCLDRLHLTPSDIRLAAIAVGVQRPPPTLAPRVVHYLEGDQKAVWERVRRNKSAFVALALMSLPAAKIAAIEGVSGECVLRRLRPIGLAKRGRPRSAC